MRVKGIALNLMCMLTALSCDILERETHFVCKCSLTSGGINTLLQQTDRVLRPHVF